MYIGVISDSHGVFDPQFREFLEPVDCIWHAGDWGRDAAFTREISDFKPVVGVHGNCDGMDIRELYPAYQFFECEGKSVLLTHIGGSEGHYDSRARALIERNRPEIFVCGHSHILKVSRDAHYDMMTINPGACGIQGWHVVRTALRFKIENGTLRDMEVFELPRSTPKYY